MIIQTIAALRETLGQVRDRERLLVSSLGVADRATWVVAVDGLVLKRDGRLGCVTQARQFACQQSAQQVAEQTVSWTTGTRGEARSLWDLIAAQRRGVRHTREILEGVVQEYLETVDLCRNV